MIESVLILCCLNGEAVSNEKDLFSSVNQQALFFLTVRGEDVKEVSAKKDGSSVYSPLLFPST